MKEVYKDIKGYENLYQISNFGNIKSLSKIIVFSSGKKRTYKEKVLKHRLSSKGYIITSLTKNSIRKTHYIHKLVAIAFLNHTPCGHKIVVDHIDNNKLNNRVDNLQLISQRENCSKDKKGTSIYTGVSYFKNTGKWVAHIIFKKETIFLGTFENELKASNIYKQALKSIKEGNPIKRHIHKKTSKYKGVCWKKREKRWLAYIYGNKKKKELGLFKTELEAHEAYLRALKEFD